RPMERPGGKPVWVGQVFGDDEGWPRLTAFAFADDLLRAVDLGGIEDVGAAVERRPVDADDVVRALSAVAPAVGPYPQWGHAHSRAAKSSERHSLLRDGWSAFGRA